MASSTPMITYSATLPDNTVNTCRSSAKVFTHAVAIQTEGVWRVVAWCSRRELADKQRNAWLAGRYPYIKAPEGTCVTVEVSPVPVSAQIPTPAPAL